MNRLWTKLDPFAYRTICEVDGVPVRLDPTLIGLIVVLSLLGLSGEGLPGLELPLTLVVIYSCVLAHEFGHVRVAKHYGVSTRRTTIYIFGGVAELESEPPSPQAELAIAIAGPAVNFGIGLVAALPAFLLDHEGALLIAAMNLRIGLFNLLPFFPMDGGRILRGLSWWRLGRLRGTMLAARIGLLGGVLLLIAGIKYTIITLWIIGPMLFLFCLGEIHMTKKRQQLAQEIQPDLSAAP